MRKLKLAILGATGAVGREMLRLVEEYEIPVERLLLLAGEKSAGTFLEFRGEALRVQAARDESFEGLDYVLGAAEPEIARRFVPAIRRAGAVLIDNSSAFRLDPEVPLVVPEINGADAKKHRGLIANPNCSTVITLMAVAAIHALSPIESMVVSTYQAVSGAGTRGLLALDEELRVALRGEYPSSGVFPAPIAMNVIPHIGSRLENGYTDEEMKLQNESRRILHSPALRVSCTCVRVPVQRSHSISVNLFTREALELQAVEDALRRFPGVALGGNGVRDFPTPLDAAGDDLVRVGRLRRDLTRENGLSLWCCGDQLRKGAAANALQILQYLEQS